MKKLVAIIISCIALAIGSSSCEDMMGSYLDKAPGIDVTEDTVFSSTAHAERFLATVYRYAVHSNLPYFTEGVMQGDMWGIKVYKIDGNNDEFRYEPYVFEKRSFQKRMYLNPFPTSEINKGYLIQNPGY